MLATAEEEKKKKKKEQKEKKRELIERHIQFTLTHKASRPFYRVGIRKKP